MFRFSIFGIQVEVQPWFWLTMILLGSNFGSNMQGTPAEILGIALFVIAGFTSILIHELGHALTARSYGTQPYIVLQAFGGYAAYPAGVMTRWQSFLITAAGPAAQLFLALVAFVAKNRLEVYMNENILSFFNDLIWVSVLWAVLNLVPVVPLDGGQMLAAIMGPKRIKITLWVSVVAGVFFGIGLYLWLELIFFPLFMGMLAWQSFQLLRQQR